MTRWLKSLFAWRAVRNSGAWLYCENVVTGQRSATLLCRGYQPLDWRFMRDGDIVHGRHGTFVIGTENEIVHG